MAGWANPFRIVYTSFTSYTYINFFALGVQYLLSSCFVTEDQYHNWSQQVHIYSGPHLIHAKLSWKDWITFAIFISCVPSATVKFCFFLAGYNSSWSVVCSCELWNLFLICAFCSALWHSQGCFLPTYLRGIWLVKQHFLFSFNIL